MFYEKMLFMPEDIPEELEFNPDVPANTSQPFFNNAIPAERESDWGSFWAIMGIVIGILVALLQMDRADMYVVPRHK
jgi:hypothetical protein